MEQNHGNVNCKTLTVDGSPISSGVTDHTLLTNIGTNTHAQVDTHIADATKHYLVGAIDHTAIANIGTKSHAQIDTHINDATKHFLVAAIDHTLISNVGTNTHAQLDTHVGDATIHFLEGSIDHTAITNIGSNSHAQVDTHIADGTKHFLEGAIDHTAIANIGTNSHGQIDTHIADATKHFLEGAIDHTAITNIGTNAHSVIDTHIANATLHFTEASIDHTAIANIGTNAHSVIDTHIADGTKHYLEGAIDHVNILSIGSNTHAQVDSHIADATRHFLEGAIDHTAITNIGSNTHAAIDTHLGDATKHFTMLDEDDLVTDSATQAATQQSIKAYVDALTVKNYAVNPIMRINQKTDSLSLIAGAVNGTREVDYWWSRASGTAVGGISWRRKDANQPIDNSFSLRMVYTAANGAATFGYYQKCFDFSAFKGKTCTIGCRAKSDVNKCRLHITDSVGFVTSANIANNNGSTWNEMTLSKVIDATTTSLTFGIEAMGADTSTINLVTNNFIEATDWYCIIGDTIPTLEYRKDDEELKECKNLYQKEDLNLSMASVQAIGVGTTEWASSHRFTTSMLFTPVVALTITDFSIIGVNQVANAGTYAAPTADANQWYVNPTDANFPNAGQSAFITGSFTAEVTSV